MSTETDRDMLARTIYQAEFDGDLPREGTADHALYMQVADALIAAGWRRIEPDQCVVSREDAVIAEHLLRGDSKTWSGKYGIDCGAAADRIAAAIAAQHEQPNAK